MTLSRVRALAKMSLDANWLLLTLIGVHMATALLLSRAYDFGLRFSIAPQAKVFAGSYLLILCAMLSLRLARRPGRPVNELMQDVRFWRVDERVAAGFPAIVGVSFFFASFSALKSAIPTMQPYAWDQKFAKWDAALHGDDAWRLIQPLVGFPAATAVLNAIYQFWLLAFYLVLAVACAADHRSLLRKQFLISFVLCWALVGNLAATLLASVGPCFMLPLLGDPRYEPLMAYLRGVAEVYPVQALVVQDMLLNDAKSGVAGLGRGISAMPSMHVSISTLLALAAWRISPRWGWAGVAFVATIMLGSVHLGYHYAVDGYVAIAMTVPIWILSGQLAERWAPRKSSMLGEARPSEL